jgi:diguanylate cyclase (GGDEF)-like protein
MSKDIVSEQDNLLKQLSPSGPSSLLVAEGDVSNREALTALLANHGYTIWKADSSSKCLEMMRSDSPDLIVMGERLADVSGHELCRSIKARYDWSEIPVIFLLGRQDAGARLVECFEAGGCDYISVPFDPVDVMARLAARLREKTLQDHYKAMATIDGLTGLMNRRAFGLRLSQSVSESKRHRIPLAFVMADLDRFKSCNDTYGHHVGDEVLREFADLLRANSRNEDVACRYGGEEFAVLLPRTTSAEAHELAERLRTTWANNIIRHDGAEIKGTCSFGVSCFDSETPLELYRTDNLVKDADVALYAAKRAGRNRVTMAHELLGTTAHADRE